MLIMKYKGKIGNINHIVVSDPTYEKGVGCRYENSDLKANDWFVDLVICSTETKIEKYYIKGTEFALLLNKNKKDCSLDNQGVLRYMNDIELKEFTIGMDTACVALGINDNAKEIIKCREEWQPSCAIRTGCDGTFGEVTEGIKNGELHFLLITGYFDEDFINENELFEYLKNRFEIVDLVKEDITLYGEDRKLNKGDIVEVSTCAINNDVGGTTMIRNSSYKDEIAGKCLSVVNPDGTIKLIELESHDKLVDMPIKVEVIEGFYDYESGYKYKGKVVDEKLLEKFKPLGIIGSKSDEYKNCKDKSIYENVLKMSKNYNPSIVSFSEFDVVKVIERNYEKGVEI